MADNQNGNGGTDWLSLAANILPAAAGAIMGARSGGIGILPGALYGVGNAARYSIDDDRERAKLNTEIAYKNSLINQGQQRTDLESRRVDLERQNYDRLDKVTDQQIQNYEQERKQRQMQMDQALKDQQGQENFRNTLPPDKQASFDADPDKKGWIKQYNANQDELAKANNAKDTLVKYGMSPEMATFLGPAGAAHYITQMEIARRQPKEPYVFAYHDGALIRGNKATGTYEKIPMDDAPGKPLTPQARMLAEQRLFNIWKQQQPKGSVLDENDTETMTKFNQWRAGTDEGKLSDNFAYGNIDHAAYQGGLQSIHRQDAQLQKDAERALHDAYFKQNSTGSTGFHVTPDFKPSESSFQQYLATPAGKANLSAYKDSLKSGSLQRPGQAAPAAATPGKKPPLNSFFGG